MWLVVHGSDPLEPARAWLKEWVSAFCQKSESHWLGNAKAVCCNVSSSRRASDSAHQGHLARELLVALVVSLRLILEEDVTYPLSLWKDAGPQKKLGHGATKTDRYSWNHAIVQFDPGATFGSFPAFASPSTV